jgi:hypothetical protein
MRKLIILPLLLLLGACSFVKLTPAGENVAILQPSEVVNCMADGSITVVVADKVVLERAPSRVAQELRILARNRAASRGDTLVPAGPPLNGEQTFNIYRCRR